MEVGGINVCSRLKRPGYWCVFFKSIILPWGGGVAAPCEFRSLICEVYNNCCLIK